MRIHLGVGISLITAGMTLALWASYDARPGSVPPFAYGMVLFAPPATPPPSAENQPPAGAEQPTPEQPAPPAAPAIPVPEDITKPLDLESIYGSLNFNSLQEIERAAERLVPTATLPLRVLWAVTYLPPDQLAPPRWIVVAVVADAYADFTLVPLAGDDAAARDAAIYAGADVPLAEVLSGKPFAAGAAGLPAARLPDSARCFRDMIIVRRSAMLRAGLEPKLQTPNVMVVGLGWPGQLEDAVRRVLPLWEKYKISARPVDLAVARDSSAWWMAAGGLAAILTGGSLILAAGLLALGRLGPRSNSVLEWLVAGSRFLAKSPRDYAKILGLMIAAVVAGAAWGGPQALGEFIRSFGAGPLAQVGLRSSAIGPADLLDRFVMTLMVTLLLRALMGIGVPSLLPGLGLVTALAHNLAWGVFLAPATLTLLSRLPIRGSVVAVEMQAYAILAFGAWRVLAGVLWPRSFGLERRRDGYAAGMNELYRLIPLAGAILVVAALLETGLTAALSHWQ
jgi:hypothetical protein